MQVTATVTDDDNTTVLFEGKASLDDYGVPDSPRFWSIEDIVITSIEYEDGTIIEGKAVTAELHDKYIGMADNIVWEGLEDDYYEDDRDDRDYND